MAEKKAKTENYTKETTAALVAAYEQAPTAETVAAWAEKLGKTAASIRMKLVREGAYKKAEYVSKTGEKPTPKADLADAIGRVLQLKEADVTSLEKASKIALQAIFKALAESKPIDEE